MNWKKCKVVLAKSVEYDRTLVEEIKRRGSQSTKPNDILQYNKFIRGTDISDKTLQLIF
jgi:hypothetical protein